ncbi:MAG TPA: radical SAM protein [Smithellaceae bacterium]|nr:radical SAM protein [Smithellaceae bacterium]
MVINRHRLLRAAGLFKRKILTDYNPKTGRSLLDGPRGVQIQTIDACNGSCACCPKTGRSHKQPKDSMDEHLYIKVIDELSRIQSLKTVALMLQNEPLMDESLAERVRQARTRLRKSVRIYIVTNGMLLSPSVAKDLFGAGLSHVEISLDALTEATFKRVRAGLDYDLIMENTRALVARTGPRKTIVRFLIQKDNAHEQKAFNTYWVQKGARVMFQDMTNRAGALSRYPSLCPDLDPDLFARIEKIARRGLPCVSGPFDRLNVLSDGRVLACCQDWRHDFLLGDLSRQSLAEIWTGEPAAVCRDMLWHGQFEKSTLCAACSMRLEYPGKRAHRKP